MSSKKITVYHCPNCDYSIEQKTLNMLRFDYECPRCNKFQFSEFKKKEW